MSARRPTIEDADLTRDGAHLLALNNAAEPQVNALSAAELAELTAMGRLRIVRDGEGLPSALLLTMREGAPYGVSLNYRWFSQRYDAFAYVDRIVVAPAARGTGVGRMLYEDAFALAAQEGLARVCAEVNVVPPNPGSLAFHQRLGFHLLEEFDNAASGKRVAMLVREPLVRASEAGAAGSEAGADQLSNVSHSAGSPD